MRQMAETDDSRFRYFLYLSYDGTAYHGWQRQPNGITVQECLENALALLARRPVPATGAGRTDTGVHARVMTAHIDLPAPLDDPAEWTMRLNRILPPDIAVNRIVPVAPDAHSRFDALSRTYRYYLTDRKDPFAGRYRWAMNTAALDVAAMDDAAAQLLQYTDFKSFSRVHTDVKTYNCRLSQAHWFDDDGDLIFEITADRFLRNMVRAVVGTLVEVGRGKLTLPDFRRIVEAKDRCRAGSSAPANGLFLYDIVYPDAVFIV